MDTDGAKQVLSVRLAGYERFALSQLADVMGVNASGAIRACFVAAMRHAMLTHPKYAMHPAWAAAGEAAWAISLFQHWACAVTDEDPSAYLEKVRLDGVTAFRLKVGCPAPDLEAWPAHISAYWERETAKAQGARARRVARPGSGAGSRAAGGAGSRAATGRKRPAGKAARPAKARKARLPAGGQAGKAPTGRKRPAGKAARKRGRT